jgi:hypothetical protein
MTTTRDKIELLAEALLDDALKAENSMTTKERVEIFKPVSLWYLGIQKAKKGDPEESGAGGTFDELRQKINGKEVTKQ